MEIHIFQKGFNYSQDGPGNRLVYHLQGCNLHCPWCSNPEGMQITGGTSYQTEELIAEVLRSRPMFFEGGGVTLTGGEVTMQFDAAEELLRELHRENISTAIETNGFCTGLKQLFPYLDLLMLDCKHYDADRLHEVTGAVFDVWRENLVEALKNRQKLAVRIPVIPGFNAGKEHAEGFVRLFDSLQLKGKASLELLPYHTYGKTKWEKLGKEYPMEQDLVLKTEELTEMIEVFERNGYALIRT